MEVNRVSLGKDRLVYVILQDKKIQYAEGRSRVVYIGTTRNGAARIATSAAHHAQDILAGRGVQGLEVRVITCQPRRHVRTWTKLERALLLCFRELYGEPPLRNVQGKGIREMDEFDYFSRARLNRILEDLA